MLSRMVKLPVPQDLIKKLTWRDEFTGGTAAVALTAVRVLLCQLSEAAAFPPHMALLRLYLNELC